MNFYSVDFGDYSMVHVDNQKYLNYFEYKGKKYPIGAKVSFTEKGKNEFVYNYSCNYIKDDFRLADHYFDCNGNECWVYIIGWGYANGKRSLPRIQSTKNPPDELVETVFSLDLNSSKILEPGELQVTFQEPNYRPKDWEVEGVMLGWGICILIWTAAFIFKDWWFRLLIQLVDCYYFSSLRNKKINEAIISQKFKNKNRS